MKKLSMLGLSVFMLATVNAQATQPEKTKDASKSTLEAPIPTIHTEASKVIAENQKCEQIKAANIQQGLDCEKELKEQREKSQGDAKVK